MYGTVESMCSTPETNTTLYVNYSSIKENSAVFEIDVSTPFHDNVFLIIFYSSVHF